MSRAATLSAPGPPRYLGAMSEQPPSRPRRRSRSDAPKASASLVRWEGGSISVAQLVHPAGRDPGYELVLWVESGSDRVVGARFAQREELLGVAGDLLQDAILGPGSGAPEKPAEVLVADRALARELRDRADALGIRVCVVPECRSWKAVVREFGAFLAAHWPGRSYLAGEGVTKEGVERLFRAAAVFYQRAPWRVLEEAPIELRLAERRRPLYAVVLGRARAVHGLTLYLSGSSLLNRGAAGSHPVRTRNTIAVTFDREDGIPPPMVDERRAHRWPLAGPAAFPLPYRQLSDGTMREPDAGELELLALALDAVAEFATRHTTPPRNGQRIVEAVQVQGANGDSIARLTFPAQIRETQRSE
jgi:hypothetical protein